MHFKDMYKKGWEQLFIFCATIGAILATDLLIGIGIGITVAILFEINKLILHPFSVFQESEKSVMEFTHNVAFFHKDRIHRTLKSLPQDKPLHLKGMSAVKLHVDVYDVIMEHKEERDRREVAVIIS